MLNCAAGPSRSADDRTLQLADYVAGRTPPASRPSVPIPAINGPWGLLGNQRALDCTFAAAGHAELVWATPERPDPPVTTSAVTTGYSDALQQGGAAAAAQPSGAGVQGAPGSEPPGITAIDALNYWRKSGVAGHRIDAYAAVSYENLAWVKYVITTFGVAYAVLGLPDAVLRKDMTPSTAPLWNVIPEADAGLDLANDHAVVYVAYDDNGLTAITWGRVMPTSWEFHSNYCTEMYAVLSPSLGEVEDVDVAKWKQDAA